MASPASTSMFGLATWHDYHYYYGHVMWDIKVRRVVVLPEGWNSIEVEESRFGDVRSNLWLAREQSVPNSLRHSHSVDGANPPSRI